MCKLAVVYIICPLVCACAKCGPETARALCLQGLYGKIIDAQVTL